MRFRAVTLDAFGTVLDTGREAVLEVAADIVAHDEIPATPRAFLAAWDDAFFELQRASRPSSFLTLAEASRRSLSTAFARFGRTGDPAAHVESLLSRWRRARPFPDAVAALESLQGIPVAIVSNADDAFLRELLERCDIRVPTIVTSESARSYKPDRGIFEAALASLASEPGRTLHVGDSYPEDVAGAKLAGMGAAWLNRRGEPPPESPTTPDAIVRDLEAVPPLLRGGRNR